MLTCGVLFYSFVGLPSLTLSRAQLSSALDAVYETAIGESLRTPRPLDNPDESPTWYHRPAPR